VIAAALLGVLVGYGAVMSLTDSGPYPVEPIDLDSDSGSSNPTSTTAPNTPGTTSPGADIVVPPPTVVPSAPSDSPSPAQPSPPPQDDDGDDDGDDDDGDDGEDDDDDDDD